jgi:hypothetical protein
VVGGKARGKGEGGRGGGTRDRDGEGEGGEGGGKVRGKAGREVGEERRGWRWWEGEGY